MSSAPSTPVGQENPVGTPSAPAPPENLFTVAHYEEDDDGNPLFPHYSTPMYYSAEFEMPDGYSTPYGAEHEPVLPDEPPPRRQQVASLANSESDEPVARFLFGSVNDVVAMVPTPSFDLPDDESSDFDDEESFYAVPDEDDYLFDGQLVPTPTFGTPEPEDFDDATTPLSPTVAAFLMQFNDENNISRRIVFE